VELKVLQSDCVLLLVTTGGFHAQNSSYFAVHKYPNLAAIAVFHMAVVYLYV